VAERLAEAGIRSIAPWLRGCGDTRFLHADTCRDGSTEALAQDAVNLMDRLDIERFAIVGHDWGARTVYALAAGASERISRAAALSLAYSPRGEFRMPPFEQARAWWYQWFMCVDRGAEYVAQNPKGFARIQWDTWSPPGWFDDATFDRVAASFDNADWIAITLNSYRARWREAPRDSRYDTWRQRIAATENLLVPTLMIQGSADSTVLASSTEGKDRHFLAGYRRVVLEGIGHFPTREAPDAVADLLIEHLG
jgi:pimeloyl-ACP methyl ester carboxylesterase